MRLAGVTLTGETFDNAPNSNGSALIAEAGATLVLSDSVVVSTDVGSDVAAGVKSLGAFTTIERSVFTANDASAYTAVWANPQDGVNGRLTIADSIFALNDTHYFARNVFAGSGVEVVNLGGNLYDNDEGGFFADNPGVGDHFGTPDYVVTSVADDIQHYPGVVALTLREAVDLANQTGGASEIWLPGWDFTLTRDRATYGGGSATDTDVSFGDIDIDETLVLRSVGSGARVGWKTGVVDQVFDLIGDANDEGIVDYSDVGQIDYIRWLDGDSSADFDDDGDIDQDDFDLLVENAGHTLHLFNITGFDG